MALRRALGTFDATMVVVGGIIGAGIFINPYLVAERLPSSGWILGAWAFGGLIALAGAFAFAELAALFPRAGGEYVYLREGYHPVVGFLFGWASLVMIQGGGIAAVAITFSQYLLRLSGAGAADPRPFAVLALVLVALVNYAGVKPGSRLLNVLVALKVGALAALIVGGLWLAPSLPRAAAIATATRPTATLLAFGAALVPILFSYGGWQNANVLAEEIREPRRTLPARPRRRNADRHHGLRPGQRRLPRDARARRPRGDGDARRERGPAPLRSRGGTLDRGHDRRLDVRLPGPDAARTDAHLLRHGPRRRLLSRALEPASALRDAPPRHPSAGRVGHRPPADRDVRRPRRLGRLRRLDLLRPDDRRRDPLPAPLSAGRARVECLPDPRLPGPSDPLHRGIRCSCWPASCG